MKDMLPETENAEMLSPAEHSSDTALATEYSLADETAALELGKLLSNHNGDNVVVLDMRQLNFWTDFFVIATVTSGAHLSGLDRHIKEFVREKNLEILRRSRKPDVDDEWNLIDLGNIVIHLMTARTRSFFELERLWSAAPLIYGDLSYSSKSS